MKTHQNKAKDTEDPKSKFFGKFDEAKATRAVAQAGATDMERAQAAAMVDVKVKQGTVMVNIGNKEEEEMESDEDENMKGKQRSPFEKAIDDSWTTRVQSLTQADQARCELQQQTSAKDAEIEQLRRVAETNDRKIEEVRQQAVTATQAAQAAQSAAEASHAGKPPGFPDDVGGNAGDGGRSAVNEGRNHQ